jgi:hypothetical protein
MTMMLAEFDWKPDNRKLRQFGCAPLILSPVIIWLWGLSGAAGGILAGICALLCAVGLVRPQALKPVYLAVSMVTIPLGLVMGEVALLLAYLIVFMPLGFMFRLFGRDGLELKVDPSASTQWREKNQGHNAASYYRQF